MDVVRGKANAGYTLHGACLDAEGGKACAGISPLEVINKMREMQEKLKVWLLSLQPYSSPAIHTFALQHTAPWAALALIVQISLLDQFAPCGKVTGHRTIVLACSVYSLQTQIL